MNVTSLTQFWSIKLTVKRFRCTIIMMVGFLCKEKTMQQILWNQKGWNHIASVTIVQIIIKFQCINMILDQKLTISWKKFIRLIMVWFKIQVFWFFLLHWIGCLWSSLKMSRLKSCDRFFCANLISFQNPYSCSFILSMIRHCLFLTIFLNHSNIPMKCVSAYILLVTITANFV